MEYYLYASWIVIAVATFVSTMGLRPESARYPQLIAICLLGLAVASALSLWIQRRRAHASADGAAVEHDRDGDDDTTRFPTSRTLLFFVAVAVLIGLSQLVPFPISSCFVGFFILRHIYRFSVKRSVLWSVITGVVASGAFYALGAPLPGIPS